MEKAMEFLKLSSEESEHMSRLTIHPHQVGQEFSFYEDFALRGIRVDWVEPTFVACTFRVLARFTDRTGKLASGAIANIVDIAGGCVVHVEGLPFNVSVDILISFLSTARPDDELEITSRALGQRAGYFGTVVVIRNKTTGEIIAEGRHSLFGNITANSKLWIHFTSVL
nr:acyl-coenzyme A thioesterase 13-like [Quercus suber]POE74199.1 acyl-coenzyme a thioesterase 13 [Quercus suber]